MVMRSRHRSQMTSPTQARKKGITTTKYRAGAAPRTPFQKACRAMAPASPMGVIHTQADRERMRALAPMARPVQAVKVTWAKGEAMARMTKVRTISSK